MGDQLDSIASRGEKTQEKQEMRSFTQMGMKSPPAGGLVATLRLAWSEPLISTPLGNAVLAVFSMPALVLKAMLAEDEGIQEYGRSQVRADSAISRARPARAAPRPNPKYKPIS